MADEDRLVDADVIADYLGVERKVVLRLVRHQLIPAIRISRKISGLIGAACVKNYVS